MVKTDKHGGKFLVLFPLRRSERCSNQHRTPTNSSEASFVDDELAPFPRTGPVGIRERDPPIHTEFLVLTTIGLLLEAPRQQSQCNSCKRACFSRLNFPSSVNSDRAVEDWKHAPTSFQHLNETNNHLALSSLHRVRTENLTRSSLSSNLSEQRVRRSPNFPQPRILAISENIPSREEMQWQRVH